MARCRTFTHSLCQQQTFIAFSRNVPIHFYCYSKLFEYYSKFDFGITGLCNWVVATGASPTCSMGAPRYNAIDAWTQLYPAVYAHSWMERGYTYRQPLQHQQNSCDLANDYANIMMSKANMFPAAKTANGGWRVIICRDNSWNYITLAIQQWKGDCKVPMLLW